MGAPFYTPSGNPIQGSDGDSKDIRDEFALIETGIEAVNQYPLSLRFADLNTAQSLWIPVPWAAQILGVSAVPSDANSTTDTVITFEIAGVLVVMDSNGELTIADTASAGVESTATPESANQVTSGGSVEIITDGGGSGVMRGTVMMILARL